MKLINRTSERCGSTWGGKVVAIGIGTAQDHLFKGARPVFITLGQRMGAKKGMGRLTSLIVGNLMV